MPDGLLPGNMTVIFNPNAGKGKGKRLFPLVEKYLKALDFKFEIYETTGPNHATELAEAAVNHGARLIVAAGGDGTLREVVNGIARAQARTPGNGPVLAIIPIGSGNDFTKSVGIPRELEAACRVIRAGQVRSIDLARVGNGWFVNAVGVGFDALATLEANRMRLLRGLPLYVTAVLKAVLSFTCPRTVIELDDRRIEQPVLMVACANGQYYGGGFHIAPEAKPDDGLLDICVIDAVSRWRIIIKLIHVIRGTHARLPEVKFYRTRKLVITSPDILYVQTDGDFMPEADPHRLEIEILPRALKLLVPGTVPA